METNYEALDAMSLADLRALKLEVKEQISVGHVEMAKCKTESSLVEALGAIQIIESALSIVQGCINKKLSNIFIF